MMNAMGDTVSRVGEPVLKRGPSGSSLKQQNQYEIRTTPLPLAPRAPTGVGASTRAVDRRAIPRDSRWKQDSRGMLARR